MIYIFTDGSSRGNPGPGGYGAVLKSGSHYKEISGGYRLTTNNRMELMAVIKALEILKKDNSNVTVYSDSLYVCNALNKGWLFNWEKRGFKKVMNPDLWTRFLELYRRHKVKFEWIKGHSGHTENERCDRLAVEASQNEVLEEDLWYVNSPPASNPDSSATVQNLLL